MQFRSFNAIGKVKTWNYNMNLKNYGIISKHNIRVNFGPEGVQTYF